MKSRDKTAAPKRMELPIRIGVAIVALLVAVWVVRARYKMCDMGRELAPLMVNINRVFAHHNISVILEGGTLIGAIRENEVLSHELDIDLAIMGTDYKRAMELKDELFASTGYHLYGVGDYIFPKAWHRAYTFTWEPFLDDPCMRVYDENQWFYADIFCYMPLTPELLPLARKAKADGHFRTPKDVDINTLTVPSNRTYYLDSWLMPTYLVAEEILLPLKQFPFYGQIFYVPHNERGLLDQLYSNWAIKELKGVRKVFCSPTLHLIVCVVVLIAAARFAWLPLLKLLRSR